MPLPQSNSRIVRFGVFELDLSAGELRKNGVKLRLQEQPFQVLAMLLERAGEVVTREELRQKLWPSDTFVDFDHSLNTAVNKVREVIGDSASSPRYVETLARRGYRFIAPVQNDVRTASGGDTTSHRLPSASTAGVDTQQAGGGVTSPPSVGRTTKLLMPLPPRAPTRGRSLLVPKLCLIFFDS